jgi:hypothetical protein
MGEESQSQRTKEFNTEDTEEGEHGVHREKEMQRRGNQGVETQSLR